MPRSRLPSGPSLMKTRASTRSSARGLTPSEVDGVKLTEEDRIKAIAADAAKSIKEESSMPPPPQPATNKDPLPSAVSKPKKPTEPKKTTTTSAHIKINQTGKDEHGQVTSKAQTTTSEPTPSDEKTNLAKLSTNAQPATATSSAPKSKVQRIKLTNTRKDASLAPAASLASASSKESSSSKKESSSSKKESSSSKKESSSSKKESSSSKKRQPEEEPEESQAPAKQPRKRVKLSSQAQPAATSAAETPLGASSHPSLEQAKPSSKKGRKRAAEDPAVAEESQPVIKKRKTEAATESSPKKGRKRPAEDPVAAEVQQPAIKKKKTEASVPPSTTKVAKSTHKEAVKPAPEPTKPPSASQQKQLLSPSQSNSPPGEKVGEPGSRKTDKAKKPATEAPQSSKTPAVPTKKTKKMPQLHIDEMFAAQGESGKASTPRSRRGRQDKVTVSDSDKDSDDLLPPNKDEDEGSDEVNDGVDFELVFDPSSDNDQDDQENDAGNASLAVEFEEYHESGNDHGEGDGDEAEVLDEDDEDDADEAGAPDEDDEEEVDLTPRPVPPETQGCVGSINPRGVFAPAGIYANSWEESSFAGVMSPDDYNKPSFGSFTMWQPPREARAEPTSSSAKNPLNAAAGSAAPAAPAARVEGTATTGDDEPDEEVLAAAEALMFLRYGFGWKNPDKQPAASPPAARAAAPDRYASSDDDEQVAAPPDFQPGMAVSSAKGKEVAAATADEDRAKFYFWAYGIYMCPDEIPKEYGAEFVGLAKLYDYRFLICGYPKRGEQASSGDSNNNDDGSGSNNNGEASSSGDRGSNGEGSSSSDSGDASSDIIPATGYATVAPIDKTNPAEAALHPPFVYGALYALPSQAHLDALLASQTGAHDYVARRLPVVLQRRAEEAVPVEGRPGEEAVCMRWYDDRRVEGAAVVVARPGRYHLPLEPPPPPPSPERIPIGERLRLRALQPRLGGRRGPRGAAAAAAAAAAEKEKESEMERELSDEEEEEPTWAPLAEGYEQAMNLSLAMAQVMYGLTSNYVSTALRKWIPEPTKPVWG